MIHHVFANKINIGDWLSARGIQTLLGKVELTEHLCNDPYVAETLDDLSRATPNDFIIIGGGGLFMDYFVPFWEGFAEIADRVPFCIWGAGYCDLKREATRPPEALLQDIVSKSQFCFVRDQLTRSHLAGCDLPAPIPCPSINAIEPAPGLGHGLLHVDNYIPVGEDVYESMVAYGKEFANCTGRPYRGTNNFVKTPGKESELKAILRLYADSDVVLSSRLHGCIIGLAMGRKVLAVSGDYKVESFMQAAGLGDWVLDLSQVESLPELLLDLPRQTSSWVFLEQARRGNQTIADQVLAGILSRPPGNAP